MMTWRFSDQASSNEIWKDIHINSMENNSYKKKRRMMESYFM